MTCEVSLSTHPVGYNGSQSTVNETNCNRKKITKKNNELNSISTQTCPKKMCLKMDAIVCIDLEGQALQLVLLFRGVDDFSSRQRLENRFKMTYHCPWYLLCSSGVR